MQYQGMPHVLVLGGNFAGLTTARFIREQCGDDVSFYGTTGCPSRAYSL